MEQRMMIASLSLDLTPEVLDLLAEQLAPRLRDLLRAEPLEGPACSPYMTIPEVADYLRCKRQRIDDLLSSRNLTRIKDGRRTLVRRAEVEAYLQVGLPSVGATLLPPRRQTQT
jgi:excisionase family DNA binding protein